MFIDGDSLRGFILFYSASTDIVIRQTWQSFGKQFSCLPLDSRMFFHPVNQTRPFSLEMTGGSITSLE